MLTFRALEVGPPGFCTVTEAVPCAAISCAVIVAVSWFALTKVVMRAAPFQRTTEALTKLLPVTVSVKFGPPATTVLGEREANVGVGAGAWVIVKGRALEVGPPGFCTVTEAVPCAAISCAVIVAVSWFALTKIVGVRAAPFHCTTEALTKLLPVTVSVKFGPPATTVLGEREANVGVGAGAWVIVKGRALEVAPPGFCTVTEAVPCAAISCAVIVAVSWFALTKVVGVRAAPFHCPFHCTTEPLTKLLPVTVSVKFGPPATTVLGEREANVGVGAGAWVIAKGRALEVAPPGFCTVTEALPCAAISCAVIVAVSWFALTKVVGVRAAPFHWTTEPLTKLLPVTVSVKFGPPATTVLGEREVNVGVGAGAWVIAKGRALEVAPPGFCTVTEAVPCAAISCAVIVAVSWFALRKVVGVRAAPFHCTTEALTKLLPVTVSVKFGPPATTVLGEREANVGVGAGAWVIAKGRALEVAPPGFCTVTEAVPCAAISCAVIVAVSWFALTKVVGVRAAPFHCTTEPLTKLLPVTVSVKFGPPATTVLGEREANVGVGAGAWVIVKGRALEVAPPGFCTVTEAVPCAAISWRGDRRGELVRVKEGSRGASRSIPLHHRTTHEIASSHRKRKFAPPATTVLGEREVNVALAPLGHCRLGRCVRPTVLRFR